MELGRYAFVRDGKVEDIEERSAEIPITELYHIDFINEYYRLIPEGQTVEPGYLYENGVFTAPATEETDNGKNV